MMRMSVGRRDAVREKDAEGAAGDYAPARCPTRVRAIPSPVPSEAPAAITTVLVLEGTQSPDTISGSSAMSSGR